MAELVAKAQAKANSSTSTNTQCLKSFGCRRKSMLQTYRIANRKNRILNNTLKKKILMKPEHIPDEAVKACWHAHEQFFENDDVDLEKTEKDITKIQIAASINAIPLEDHFNRK
jgi:hypothetical protein